MEIKKNNNTIEITCTHCRSVLLVNFGDIKDSPEIGTHVTCAACDQVTCLRIQNGSTKEWPAPGYLAAEVNAIIKKAGRAI